MKRMMQVLAFIVAGWTMNSLPAVHAFGSMFVMDPTLSGRHFAAYMQEVTSYTPGIVLCAAQCEQIDRCSSFTYDALSQRCSVTTFWNVSMATTSSTAAAGTVLYTRRDYCPTYDGFVHLPDLDLCFKMYMDIVNLWDTAVQNCADQGLRLIKLDTDAKIEAIRQHILNDPALQSPAGTDYYIGASVPKSMWGSVSSWAVSDFQWTDGTPVQTTLWDVGEPDCKPEQYVLALYAPNFLVRDRPYTRPYRYVCQKVL